MIQNSSSMKTQSFHKGFTLIEMLVAITIMLVVFTMTAGVVSLAINTDRIPSSARTIQAALMGARDRALRAGRTADSGENPRRGIRFVLNPNQPNSIGSMVYIGSQADWTQGELQVTEAQSAFTQIDTNWNTLSAAGVDLAGARIKLLDGSGTWFRLTDFNNFTRPFPSNLPDPPFDIFTYEYRLQLPSTVLPNEQPLPLDGNVVINLDLSADHGVIPSDWYNKTGAGTSADPFLYPSYNQGVMEIQFTSDGNVYGPLAAQGPIYFYLSSLDDFLAERISPPDRISLPKGRDPADPAAGEALIVKINTQTGLYQTFPADPTDNVHNSDQSAGADGLADNPFRIAQQQ